MLGAQGATVAVVLLLQCCYRRLFGGGGGAADRLTREEVERCARAISAFRCFAPMTDCALIHWHCRLIDARLAAGADRRDATPPPQLLPTVRIEAEREQVSWCGMGEV